MNTTMHRTPYRQGLCYVARSEIDSLLARRGEAPALLRRRMRVVLDTADSIERFAPWPALEQSLRADAERLRVAAGLPREPESERIDAAIVGAVRAGVHPLLDRAALSAAAAQAARTGRTRERVISLHLDTLRQLGRIAYVAKRWEIRS